MHAESVFEAVSEGAPREVGGDCGSVLRCGWGWLELRMGNVDR
jgi:hypothetical protein